MGTEEVSFRAYLIVLLKRLEKLLREGAKSTDSCIIMAVAESISWLLLGVLAVQVSVVTAAVLFALAILRGSYWLWRAEKCCNG